MEPGSAPEISSLAARARWPATIQKSTNAWSSLNLTFGGITGPGGLDPAHFPDNEGPQRDFMEVVERGDARGYDGLS